MRKLFALALFAALIQGVCVQRIVAAEDQPATDQKAITDLVEKVLKAHGGKAALGKFVACEMMVKGYTFQGDTKTPTSYGMICQGVDKQRTVVFDSETNTQVLQVNDGLKGWTKVGDEEPEAQSDAEVKINCENGYLNWITTVFPLKQKEYKLSLIDEVTVKGEAAVGLLVRREKHDDVKLYFDKKTYLLVKIEHPFHNVETGANVTEVEVLSNYKTVQGIKQPYKGVTYWDGTLQSDVEIVELKLHEKRIDDKLFEKP